MAGLDWRRSNKGVVHVSRVHVVTEGEVVTEQRRMEERDNSGGGTDCLRYLTLPTPYTQLLLKLLLYQYLLLLFPFPSLPVLY